MSSLTNCLVYFTVPVWIDKTDLILDPKVIVGRAQILDCPAVGIPIPRIVWFKDGQNLDLRKNRHIKILQDGRQLQIMEAKVSDASHFECRATNEAGSDSVIYDLQVLGMHICTYITVVYRQGI